MERKRVIDRLVGTGTWGNGEKESDRQASWNRNMGNGEKESQ